MDGVIEQHNHQSVGKIVIKVQCLLEVDLDGVQGNAKIKELCLSKFSLIGNSKKKNNVNTGVTSGGL